MAIAELHGKMPFSYFEDMLTADVFTAFRYLPADRGIIGFLRSVRGIERMIPSPDEASACTIYFWPKGRYCGREPDLLLELKIRKTIYHVVVEAKYLSGPTDYDHFETELDGEPVTLGNQLADEFRDLLHGDYTVEPALKGHRHMLLRSEPQNRLLLYLTAHFMEPRGDLEWARNQIEEADDRIFWSSWYQVYDYLGAARRALDQFPYQLVIKDALALLGRKGFSLFEGIRQPPGIDLTGVSGHFLRPGEGPLMEPG